MAKIFLKKTIHGLAPFNIQASEVLDKLKMGSVVSANVTKPRNVKFSSKYWVMVDLIFKNQSYYRTPEAVNNAIKQKLGYCDIYRQKEGPPSIEYHSISFAKMDDLKFQEFYQAAVDFVCDEIIPGLEQSDLAKELEQFQGR